MNKVFGITGWKNSGKTTLVASLVREFTARGLSVSTVKNASEQFDIDHPQTDSHAHRLAGAQEVAIVSPKRWALMHELANHEAPPSLDEMIAKLAPCDLVLVEGFKSAPHKKIECVRDASKKEAPIWATNESIVAVASPATVESGSLPRLDLNNIPEIANFIAEETGLSL